MRGRRRCALLAIGGLAAAAAAPPPAPAQRLFSCAQVGSRTVLSTASARVYYDRRARPWACRRRTGRRTRLDRFVDAFYAPRDARLGQLRISGDVLGYTWIDPGIPAVYVHSVDLRSSRYLRRTRIEPRVVIDPAAVAVTGIALRPTGGIAWIQRLEGAVSVWRFDSRGRRRLDARRRIFVRSLRLAGTLLSWRQAGILRRSTLR
jgi:hypothetical protein